MKFYAVIHVCDVHGYHPMVSAQRALHAGADGVFVINHGVRPSDLIDVANRVHAEFPDMWMGMNLLGVRAEDAFHLLPEYVKGLWMDNAGDAQRVQQARARSEWKGEYFGGVAFKYQQQPADLKQAVITASTYMEVVTTSGPGTGRPPELEKIQIMGDAAKSCGRGLAIASGVTPENVTQYMPHATHVLVATGVSKSFQELDFERMKRLVDVIRN
jgi:predicted TIM-barrel enzyme